MTIEAPTVARRMTAGRTGALIGVLIALQRFPRRRRIAAPARSAVGVPRLSLPRLKRRPLRDLSRTVVVHSEAAHSNSRRRLSLLLRPPHKDAVVNQKKTRPLSGSRLAGRCGSTLDIAEYENARRFSSRVFYCPEPFGSAAAARCRRDDPVPSVGLFSWEYLSVIGCK